MARIYLFPLPPWKLRRRLRAAGWTVLLIGTIGAWVAYRLQMRYIEMMSDPSMAGFYKAETRQMGEFYGKMGLVFEGFLLDLKQPGTRAGIILALALIVALICFYLAGRAGEAIGPGS